MHNIPACDMSPLNDVAHEDWENPVPFEKQCGPAIKAGDVLDGVLCDFVEAWALSAEVPEALPLMTTLGVISACAAKYVFVSPKPGWNEPVNIYSIIALPPANNKTLILNECLAPLVAWEKQQAEIMQPEQTRTASLRKSQEKMIDAKRSALAKTEGADELHSLMEKIAQLEQELPEISSLPKLFANDITPESLGQSLFEQKGRFAIFSDEGGVMEILSGLYSGGNTNADIILKGIDGGHVRTKRKDKEYDLNPYLTLILAVQPQILRNIASKRAFNGNGVQERFLYIVPESRLGYRTHNTPPVPDTVTHDYHALIAQLLQRFYTMAQEDNPSPIVLSLSPEASNVWKEFQAEVETMLRPNGKLHSFLGWGGKICGYTLRIAGMLHIANEVKNAEISLSHMQKAIHLATFLIDHALVAHGLMGCDESIADAKEVWEWMKEQGEAVLTKRDIVIGLKNRPIGKKVTLDASLKYLCKKHYLCKTINHNTRKPTLIYEVNPYALDIPEQE